MGRVGVRRLIVPVLAGLCLLAVGSAVAITIRAMNRDTGKPGVVSDVSPDGRYRAKVVEIGGFYKADRNFEVVLTDVRDGSDTIVFTSPDEGRPAGTERFVWNAGGESFALLGRHFFTEDDYRFANGECLYLVYRIPTRDLWCNATQAKSPRLSLWDAGAMGFKLPDIGRRQKSADEPAWVR
jgi:hypothetical protein